MMGRGLERLSEVPAGCMLAIGGLERCILKSATLSSTLACRPLAPMLFQVRPVCIFVWYHLQVADSDTRAA